MKSCGKEVYKVDKSKEDTCEPLKVRRLSFSMTSLWVFMNQKQLTLLFEKKTSKFVRVIYEKYKC